MESYKNYQKPPSSQTPKAFDIPCYDPYCTKCNKKHPNDLSVKKHTVSYGEAVKQGKELLDYGKPPVKNSYIYYSEPAVGEAAQKVESLLAMSDKILGKDAGIVEKKLPKFPLSPEIYDPLGIDPFEYKPAPTKSESKYFQFSRKLRILRPSVAYITKITKEIERKRVGLEKQGMYPMYVIIDEYRWLKVAAYLEKKVAKLGGLALLPIKMKKGVKYMSMLPALADYPRYVVNRKASIKASKNKGHTVKIPKGLL